MQWAEWESSICLTPRYCAVGHFVQFYSIYWFPPSFTTHPSHYESSRLKICASLRSACGQFCSTIISRSRQLIVATHSPSKPRDIRIDAYPMVSYSKCVYFVRPYQIIRATISFRFFDFDHHETVPYYFTIRATYKYRMSSNCDEETLYENG